MGALGNLKRTLMAERGMDCEVDGCVYFAEEAHHCFFHTMKSKKILDDPRNIQLVCKYHHGTIANSYENERSFWARQCDRYGEATMLKWWIDVPLKYKERWW